MPIVDFFGTTMKAPEGDLRNSAFLVAHCWFFLFNLLNASYIILFEGFAFRRFGQNYLLKLALTACLLQICSCITSIHRFNINDEFGIYGRIGTLLGLLAFTFFNIAYLHLIFTYNRSAIRWGKLLWIVIGVATFVLGEVNWDTRNFFYFQIYVGGGNVYQTIALILCHRSLKRGAISIDPSIISSDAMLRTLKVLIGLSVFALGLVSLSRPVLTYPSTGLTFTLMVIAMSFTGRMDFMTKGEVDNRDRQPLV